MSAGRKETPVYKTDLSLFMSFLRERLAIDVYSQAALFYLKYLYATFPPE